jgi:hypothetical protein
METLVKMMCPSAQMNTSGNEPFEIWFERKTDLKVLGGFYEVIGGGETEAEAWEAAFKYLMLTPKEQW